MVALNLKKLQEKKAVQFNNMITPTSSSGQAEEAQSTVKKLSQPKGLCSLVQSHTTDIQKNRLSQMGPNSQKGAGPGVYDLHSSYTDVIVK